MGDWRKKGTICSTKYLVAFAGNAAAGTKLDAAILAVFDQRLPRSATAHVLVEARVLSLDQGKLRGLILSHPELALGLLRGLSLRLRAMNTRIAAGPVPAAGTTRR